MTIIYFQLLMVLRCMYGACMVHFDDFVRCKSFAVQATRNVFLYHFYPIQKNQYTLLLVGYHVRMATRIQQTLPIIIIRMLIYVLYIYILFWYICIHHAYQLIYIIITQQIGFFQNPSVLLNT